MGKELVYGRTKPYKIVIAIVIPILLLSICLNSFALIKLNEPVESYKRMYEPIPDISGPYKLFSLDELEAEDNRVKHNLVYITANSARFHKRLCKDFVKESKEYRILVMPKKDALKDGFTPCPFCQE